MSVLLLLLLLGQRWTLRVSATGGGDVRDQFLKYTTLTDSKDLAVTSADFIHVGMILTIPPAGPGKHENIVQAFKDLLRSVLLFSRSTPLHFIMLTGVVTSSLIGRDISLDQSETRLTFLDQ